MKVDLVIPTYNRTKFLERILDYYKESGKDFRFIIADSSNPKNKALNKTIIKRYNKLNILHLDYPETMPQHQKFIKMVKYIKSKYCVFCPDDDFIIPNSIKEAVKFLEKNPDYSAAHGTYIGFYLFKNVLGKLNLWWRFRDTPHTISSNNPVDRVASHLNNFTLVLWAVRRADIVKIAYNEFSKIKVDPLILPIFGELLPDTLTIVYGKVRSMNNLYAARSYFESVAGYYPNLKDSMRAGIYAKEYSKFKKCLIDNLQKNHVSNNKASKTIDLAMEKFIKDSDQQYIMNQIYLVLKLLPTFIAKSLNLIHAYYLFSKPKKNKIGMIDNTSSKYFHDFEKIRQNILEHTY